MLASSAHREASAVESCLRFGPFELVASSGELFRRDRRSRLRPIKLQPQPARVLLHLVERAGVLVTRSELQRQLWGDDYFVDHEQGLNYCVRAIRKALGDDAGAPVFIETIPRHGYRFLAHVETDRLQVELRRPAQHPVEPARAPGRSAGPRLVLGLLGLAAIGLCFRWWRSGR